MQDIVQFLINNVDVLIKVKEGQASLIGVSPEELKAIMEVFFDDQMTQKAYYWM
jgi:competence protein ComX